MLVEQTKDKLAQLKLPGFIEVFNEILANPGGSLTQEETMGLMVDRELLHRENRRLKRLLKAAKLRFPQASIETIDYQLPRKFNQQQVRELTHCSWITQGRSIIFSGPCGVGKSFLACAFGHQACRLGLSVRYFRMSHLLERWRIAQADGSYGKLLATLEKTQLLILDDWGMGHLNEQERQSLLEVCEARYGIAGMVITTQLPTEHWHNYIGDDTIADAICDRIIHSAYVIKIEGDSLRKYQATKEKENQTNST